MKKVGILCVLALGLVLSSVSSTSGLSPAATQALYANIEGDLTFQLTRIALAGESQRDIQEQMAQWMSEHFSLWSQSEQEAEAQRILDWINENLSLRKTQEEKEWEQAMAEFEQAMAELEAWIQQNSLLTQDERDMAALEDWLRANGWALHSDAEIEQAIAEMMAAIEAWIEQNDVMLQSTLKPGMISTIKTDINLGVLRPDIKLGTLRPDIKLGTLRPDIKLNSMNQHDLGEALDQWINEHLASLEASIPQVAQYNSFEEYIEYVSSDAYQSKYGWLWTPSGEAQVTQYNSFEEYIEYVSSDAYQSKYGWLWTQQPAGEIQVAQYNSFEEYIEYVSSDAYQSKYGWLWTPTGEAQVTQYNSFEEYIEYVSSDAYQSKYGWLWAPIDQSRNAALMADLSSQLEQQSLIADQDAFKQWLSTNFELRQADEDWEQAMAEFEKWLAESTLMTQQEQDLAELEKWLQEMGWTLQNDSESWIQDISAMRRLVMTETTSSTVLRAETLKNYGLFQLMGNEFQSQDEFDRAVADLNDQIARWLSEHTLSTEKWAAMTLESSSTVALAQIFEDLRIAVMSNPSTQEFMALIGSSRDSLLEFSLQRHQQDPMEQFMSELEHVLHELERELGPVVEQMAKDVEKHLKQCEAEINEVIEELEEALQQIAKEVEQAEQEAESEWAQTLASFPTQSVQTSSPWSTIRIVLAMLVLIGGAYVVYRKYDVKFNGFKKVEATKPFFDQEDKEEFTSV